LMKADRMRQGQQLVLTDRQPETQLTRRTASVVAYKTSQPPLSVQPGLDPDWVVELCAKEESDVCHVRLRQPNLNFDSNKRSGAAALLSEH
jgi:hypothetical protein